MKFGPVPVRDALGAIAAHSIRATARPYALQLDYKIAKGTELTADHIEDLIEEGHSEIVVARLESGDVHENDAALRLAQALVPDADGQGLRISGAGAGRVNLYALNSGVLQLDASQIAAVNAIDPMITVATVPN
ncbi:MAG: molybdopterin biosynthesis protein, partial [Tritonibacter mobilis]|nr:molybdopterin biosynthesis protein [Tritonibacter mobilis]